MQNDQKLIEMLKSSIVQGEEYDDDSDGNNSVIEDSDSIIEGLKRLKSMDDISFITVYGDLFGRDNQHQYWHHTYYRDRNTTAYDEGGEDVYSEGTGGRINFYVSGKRIKRSGLWKCGSSRI